MTTFQTSFSLQLQNCLHEFIADLDLEPDELLILRSTSLNDLQKVLRQIQECQKASRSMLYMKRLSPFLEAIVQYCEVLEIFLAPKECISCIWGCVKILCKTAAVSSDAFSLLLDAYRSLGQALPQLSQHKLLFQTKPYFQPILVSIFEDISRFHSEAIRRIRVRTWNQLFTTTWRALRPYIMSLTTDLRSCRTLLEGDASLTEVSEFQSMREALHEQLQSTRRAELNSQRDIVQQWLSFANNETRHEDASADRHPGTGTWLLQDEKFQAWFNSDYCIEPLLWLSGKPGAGKTVLASLVIDEIRSHLTMVRTVFFYCRQSDGHRNGFVAIAKTILTQLAVHDDGLLLYLHDKAAKSGEAVLSSINLARSLLDTALKTCNMTQKVYIVIDGLDEYSRNDRKDIASWFRSAIENLPQEDFGAIRCLFISQDDGDARKDFNNISHIGVSSDLHHQDIQRYCDFWHERISHKFGSFSDFNIANVVTAKAQGMFLYAKLVMNNLYEQATRQNVEDELKPGIFPVGLQQAYTRVLDRVLGPLVQPGKRNKAKQVLGWLACARRPLKWYEIQGAISIDLEQSSVNYNREFKDTCKDLCASLVEINADGAVVLVHTTAKHYLIEQGCIMPNEVQYELALLSLGYLSFEHFSNNNSPERVVEMLSQGTFAFAEYAVCFWALHLEAAIAPSSLKNAEDLEVLAESLEVFLETHWMEPRTPCVLSKTNVELLEPLKTHWTKSSASCALAEDDVDLARPIEPLPIYSQASQAIITSKIKLHSRAKHCTDNDVLLLPQIIQTIRRSMEQIKTSSGRSSEIIERISRFHGPNWFKCDRLNCQFYHQGFASLSERKHHIDRHDRAYACTSEGCPYATIGFVTKAELNKHVFKDHGFELGDSEFPDEDLAEKADDVHPSMPPPSTRLPCTKCSKTFTRKNNLEAHMRTHTNERPHACSICGKTFIRLADRQRHEVIHNRKIYRCKGTLSSGASWGCGLKFEQLDKFGQHFRSEGGRFCIKPLEEEEMMDLRRKWQQQELEDQGPGPKTVLFLPSKLLDTYPELKSLPWDTYDLPPAMAPESMVADENRVSIPNMQQWFLESSS